jgi:hypothetical protein
MNTLRTLSLNLAAAAGILALCSAGYDSITTNEKMEQVIASPTVDLPSMPI